MTLSLDVSCFFVTTVLLLLFSNGESVADDLLQSTSLQYISFGSIPDLPIADRLLNYRRGSDVVGLEPRIETLNIPKQKCPREAACAFMSNCPIQKRVQPQTACEVSLNSAGTQMLLPGGICCYSNKRNKPEDPGASLVSAVLDDINRRKQADLDTPTRPKAGHLVNFVSPPNAVYGYDKSPLELLPPNEDTKMSYLPGKVPVEIPQRTPQQALNDPNAQTNGIMPPYWQPSVSTSGQPLSPNQAGFTNQPTMSFQPPQSPQMPPYIPPRPQSPPQLMQYLPQTPQSAPYIPQTLQSPPQFPQNFPPNLPPNTNFFQGPLPSPPENYPSQGPLNPSTQFQPPPQVFFPNNQPGNPNFPLQPLQNPLPNPDQPSPLPLFSPQQSFQPMQPQQLPIAQQQYVAYGPNGPYTAFVPLSPQPQPPQNSPQSPPKQFEPVDIPTPFIFNFTQPQPQTIKPAQPLNISSTSSTTFCGARDIRFAGRTSRILGGRPSDFGGWPWMAVILSSGRLRCGATILNEQFLITAAHCVFKNFQYGYYRDLSIRIGLYSMDEDDYGLFGPETVSISRVFIHPFFNATQSSFDVALVQLDSAIKFKPHIKPVCLPSGEHLGEMGTVLGWGKRKETDDRSNLPMVLQEVKIPILFPWQCYLQLRSKKIYEEVKPQYICAGGRPNQDACRGDSGGPLLALTGGSYWELIGIVSKGYGCGQENVPGFYTNIFFVKDWIESTVSSNWNYFMLDPTMPFSTRERSDFMQR